MASAFEMAIRSDIRGQVLNIIADEKISIKDLVVMFISEYPTDIEIKPSRKGDIASSIVSSNLARRLLIELQK